MRTPASTPHRRPAWRAILILLAALALLASLARAIQTQEVEIGNGGAYDGAVKLSRDAQGRLLLRDGEVTQPITLNDLRYAGRDHGLLLGLGDDDHLQYQNSARHATAHTAAFNSALAITPDLHGNATLGSHVSDSEIHLKRSAAETIPGAWLFSGTPLFQAGLYLNNAGAPGDARLLFSGSAGDAEILWKNANNRFELNRGCLLGGNLTIGAPGSADRSLVINSANSASYGILNTSPSILSLTATGVAMIFGSTSSYLQFYSGVNQPIYFDAEWNWRFRDKTHGNIERLLIEASNGDINNLGGAYKTNGVTRLAADGSAALTQATLSGDLAVGSGSGKITLNGQRLLNETNLLDNPDFDIWQRNAGQMCATGGNTGGTLTWPVPGTLITGADRWQISRAKTDTVTSVSRTSPPAPLPTALYCLKNEYTAGTDCAQYIHQTLPRQQTAALRGRWVTFAISHYLNGAGGGNIAIYKFTGGTPTALVNYAFTATPNSWDRLAVAAQVPSDTEILCVSIKSGLTASGPTAAWIANAVLVEGKYVGTTEKVSDPAASSVPPLPRRPAENLAACQRYYEKGSLWFTSYAPNTSLNDHYTTIHYNTAKASASLITLSGVSNGGLTNVSASTTESPAGVAGAAWPQGFTYKVTGSLSAPGPVILYANWTAACPEPI